MKDKSKRIFVVEEMGAEYVNPNTYAIENGSYRQKVAYYIKEGKIPTIKKTGLIDRSFPFPIDLKAGRPVIQRNLI